MKSLLAKAFAPCASMYSLPSHGIRVTHARLSSTVSSGGLDAEWWGSIAERTMRRLKSRGQGQALTKANLRVLDGGNEGGDGGGRATGRSGLPFCVKRVVGQLKRLFSGPAWPKRGEHRCHAAGEAESPVVRDARCIGASRDGSKDREAKDLEKTEVEERQAEKAGRDRGRVVRKSGVGLGKNHRVVVWLESLPGAEEMAGPHGVM